MIAFLSAIDDEVWDVVEGYTRPTVVANGQTILKPKAQWTQAEKRASNYNNKAISAIFNGFTTSEFREISQNSTAKVAWDTLQTIHEGTDTVKHTKLQNLTIAFETLRMKDTKTFDEFYPKLSNSVNSSFNLEGPISEVRVVNKILRSLLARFVQKWWLLRSIKIQTPSQLRNWLATCKL